LWLTLFLAALLLSQSGPVVGITVDNPFPNPGGTITITICTCLAPQGWNDSLWLSIDSPDGHSLYYQELGTGYLTTTIPYKIPQDAPSGFYTVTVTWDHQYVQTGFTVDAQPIPEFPFPLPVFLVAIAAATLAISRRQATARFKTLTTHS
jgi:hypothetical protein